MFVPIRSLSSCFRFFHTSPQRCNHLIAPPDPISHMRPVIYDDAPLPSPPSLLRHPYSLSEFMTDSQSRRGELELQLKLERQQLDAFHQTFWLDVRPIYFSFRGRSHSSSDWQSNTRFEAAKDAVLASMPSSSIAFDREKGLSEFYKQWCMQEASRTSDYTKEWRKRNFSLILLGVRAACQIFTIRFSDLVSWKKSRL